METLAGRYRIVREIARRAEVTYEALDERLGRRVIVKELVPPADMPAARVAALRERFLEQARASAGLSHPNIMRTYDAFEEAGRAYAVLEYLEGGSLEERLATAGPLPLPEALEVLRQLLDALETAGRRGIVHRDIKPANLTLTPGGTLKVLDFGIAVREGQRVEVRAGTPNYVAPEQLRGEPLDRRADLFSAAVSFYVLATGRRPFEGETVEETLQRIDHVEPPMPRAWPGSLCRLLRRAMAKLPGSRYASAGEMLADLQELVLPAVPEPAAERGSGSAALEGLARWNRVVGQAGWVALGFSAVVSALLCAIAAAV
jgi:serine/threonine protein kinase